ncbi:MAG TPA: hypothetical protein PLE74_13135 [Candidatus Cloacimonadota bacterium]|nr:hypothetical protein [Candidatus Cloacimonadota bacterium]
MKPYFKHMIHGFTGKLDGLIYYIDKFTGRPLARKKFRFKNHPGQKPFKSAQTQIYALKPSQAYKYNLKDYCMSYNNLPQNTGFPIFSWCHVYNKLMWAMQKAMPEQVILEKITREQIEKEQLPCITLKAAIDAGLLPKVWGYERWDAVL